MKIRNSILMIFLVAFAAGIAVAQPDKKISFEATEYFDPFNLLGSGPVGSYQSFGTIHCPSYEQTDPSELCPEGLRTHARGIVWISRVESGTAGIPDGWMTVTNNANLDPEFNGPQWGTFSLAYDGGGYFEGTWQSVRRKEGDAWISDLHVRGTIIGGPYDGATVIATDHVISYFPIPFAYTGEIQGTIINP
jgi:hypothetical protein